MRQIDKTLSIASAYWARDATHYVEACVAKGVPVDDEYLLERYDADRMHSQNRNASPLVSLPAPDVRAVEDDGNLGYALSIVVPIALRRFPELERGERIGVREIKKRLSKIREAGYNVKPYSKMSREESWAYLQEIRNAVARDAREHCPSELEKVSALNDRLRRDAVDIR